MCCHDPGQEPIAQQFFVGLDVVEDVPVLTPVDRQLLVRIADDPAMSWKMLGDGSHSRAAQPAAKCHCQLTDDSRNTVKRPVANHLAEPPVEIDTRCKTEIDANRPKFGCNQPASILRQLEPGFQTALIFVADISHRRDAGKSLLKALYAPTFMVRSDYQARRTQRAYLADEVGKLLGGLVIAGKKDDPADGRFEQ